MGAKGMRTFILAAAVLSLSTSLVALILHQVWQPYVIMSSMMSRMMGSASVWVPSYVVILPYLWLVSGAIGLTLLFYLVAFPTIRHKHVEAFQAPQGLDLTEFLTRFLRPDELLVVRILRQAGGERSQRDIGREAGYSRIKTHRVIARLAERGIVTVERRGATNLVKLAVSPS